MSKESEIGKKLVNKVWDNKKYSEIFFNRVENSIRKLNNSNRKKTTRVYDSLIKSLEINDKGFIVNSTLNLSKLQNLTFQLNIIQDDYRQKYGLLNQEYREDSFGILLKREKQTEDILNSIGITDNRNDEGVGANELIKLMNKQHFKKMNDIISKWNNFAYNTFFSAITNGLNILDLKNSLYTDDGNIKIGSSFEQQTTAETMIAITEQRTAFLREEAKRNNYTYCWNSNPLDAVTKPQCIRASLAGVISEEQMEADHGFPPRFICRCEIVYTRPEWVDLNKGINEALAERRETMLIELDEAPKKKIKWLRDGKWVKSKIVTTTDQMYARIKENIDLIKKTEVPEFEYDGPSTFQKDIDEESNAV